MSTKETIVEYLVTQNLEFQHRHISHGYGHMDKMAAGSTQARRGVASQATVGNDWNFLFPETSKLLLTDWPQQFWADPRGNYYRIDAYSQYSTDVSLGVPRFAQIYIPCWEGGDEASNDSKGRRDGKTSKFGAGWACVLFAQCGCLKKRSHLALQYVTCVIWIGTNLKDGASFSYGL